MKQEITLHINGVLKTFRSPQTLESLLKALNLEALHIAIAVNDVVVARAERKTRILSGGDRVEIIRAVAGG